MKARKNGGRTLTQSNQIHEKLTKLLEMEEPVVRIILTEVIQLAQSKRFSAENVAITLQRKLDVIMRGEDHHADR